jgi:Asp-tRNA(Asn)/Glu-tRNA(Gln) amidotransferase A subunit family amidase
MQAGSALEGLGHYVEMIDCIPFESAAFHAAARRIWCANLSNVAHQLAVAKGVKPCADYFEACTLTCIEAGARLSALDMEDALATMTRISLAMATAFARYDAIILPPARTISPRIGYLNQNTTGMSADAYYDLIFDIYPYTGPFNMTGQPAISLPTGHVRGLPVGVQIAAAMAREDTLLSLAAELEVVLPWKDRRPLVHVSVAQ